mgnify:FL=1
MRQLHVSESRCFACRDISSTCIERRFPFHAYFATTLSTELGQFVRVSKGAPLDMNDIVYRWLSDVLLPVRNVFAY